MAESTQPAETPRTYEEIRDSVGAGLAAHWRNADREEGHLEQFYRSLQDDERFTEAEKARQAWEQYERSAPKITAGRKKARELLKGRVRSAWAQSIPFPPGEGPFVSDVSKLLVNQNEASRIRSRLDRAEREGKGPFRADRTALLREEYRRALEVGGVQGGAICRGVIGACEDFGIELDSVVDAFREDRHRQRLTHASEAGEQLDLISTNVPQPPFPRPDRAVVAGEPKQAQGSREKENPFEKKRRGRPKGDGGALSYAPVPGYQEGRLAVHGHGQSPRYLLLVA
jgi:hypothetical protein